MAEAVRLRGRKSLRRQIYVIAVVAVLVIAIAGIAVYTFVSNLLVQKEMRHVDSVVQQLSVELSTLAASQAQLVDNLVLNHNLLAYLRAGNPSERFVHWQAFSDTINTLITLNNTVDIMLIFDNDRLLLNRSKNTTSYSVVYAIEDIFALYTERLDLYSGPIYDHSGQGYYYAYLRSVYDNSQGANIGQKLGTIVLLSRLTRLRQIMESASLTENAVFAILDQAGAPVVAASETLPYIDPAVMDALPRDEQTNLTATIDGRKLLIHAEPVPQMGWQIVSFIPLAELNADLRQFMVYAGAFLLCVVLVFILVMLHVMGNIMKPITQIATFAQRSAEYSLKNRLAGIADNEIGQLAGYINGMLDAIDDLTHRLLKGQQEMHTYEIAKVQAELSALQSQINPHFLYNTLDCVKGYGYLLGSDEIVGIANNLSGIMRYCIKGPEMVSVDMELQSIAQYLEIIDIRFKGRFRFVMDVAEDLRDFMIPRLILQPLVENAIYHGLEPKVGPGTLWIRIGHQGGAVMFVVQDDGVGMPEERVTQLQQSTEEDPLVHTASIGLANVFSRLRLVFGAGVTIGVESRIGEGTVVRMLIHQEPKSTK